MGLGLAIILFLETWNSWFPWKFLILTLLEIWEFLNMFSLKIILFFPGTMEIKFPSKLRKLEFCVGWFSGISTSWNCLTGLIDILDQKLMGRNFKLDFIIISISWGAKRNLSQRSLEIVFLQRLLVISLELYKNHSWILLDIFTLVECLINRSNLRRVASDLSQSTMKPTVSHKL